MNLIPDISLTLKEIGGFMLPVTGTILGLIYAALIYWLQGGLSRLEYSKSLVEESLINSARILLDLLVGASVISLCGYFEFRTLASIAFWIFFVVFIYDQLRLLAEQGYIRTLTSNKFVPASYGKLRSFLRRIRLAGIPNIFNTLLIVTVVAVYPIYISAYQKALWQLSDTSLIIFIFATALFSLLQIKSLLTTAFDIKKSLEKQLMNKNEEAAMKAEELPLKWSDSKRSVEQKIILERLRSINVHSTTELKNINDNPIWNSRMLDQEPVLNGYPVINDTTSCHLNIIIPYLNDDSQTRDFIFTWTRTILVTISESKTEVRNFALSFFRKDENNEQIHLALFRATSDEINKANSKQPTALDFIRDLSGRSLDNAISMI